MLKAIAIDDEPRALKVIELFAEKISFLEIIRTFRSAIDALEYLRMQNDIDLIFLDINMPDLNGIEFLDSLRKPIDVIFTTAYSEYALQSYDYNAIGYLLKPIDFSRFLKAVQKADELKKLHEGFSDKGSYAEKDSLILIKSGTKTYNISKDHIRFIEASGNYTYFMLPGKKLISDHTLTELENYLPSACFRRIHRSYIVNLAYIETIEKHQVNVKGHAIPIGKTYRAQFLKEFKK